MGILRRVFSKGSSNAIAGATDSTIKDDPMPPVAVKKQAFQLQLEPGISVTALLSNPKGEGLLGKSRTSLKTAVGRLEENVDVARGSGYKSK